MNVIEYIIGWLFVLCSLGKATQVIQILVVLWNTVRKLADRKAEEIILVPSDTPSPALASL